MAFLCNYIPNNVIFIDEGSRKPRPKSATQRAVEAKVFSLAIKEESDEEEEEEDLGGRGIQEWADGDEEGLDNYLEYEDENIDVRLMH